MLREKRRKNKNKTIAQKAQSRHIQKNAVYENDRENSNAGKDKNNV